MYNACREKITERADRRCPNDNHDFSWTHRHCKYNISRGRHRGCAQADDLAVASRSNRFLCIIRMRDSQLQLPGRRSRSIERTRKTSLVEGRCAGWLGTSPPVSRALNRSRVRRQSFVFPFCLSTAVSSHLFHTRITYEARPFILRSCRLRVQVPLPVCSGIVFDLRHGALHSVSSMTSSSACTLARADTYRMQRKDRTFPSWRPSEADR